MTIILTNERRRRRKTMEINNIRNEYQYQLIGFDHMSIEKRAKEERNPTMLSFQIVHDKNLCCSCIAEIFENLLQAGTMKALRMKTAAHKRRRRRIKCAKKGKNKPNLENSNFLNLSQRSGVRTASGWFGGRQTSPRPRS